MTDEFHFMTDKFHFMTEPTRRNSPIYLRQKTCWMSVHSVLCRTV